MWDYSQWLRPCKPLLFLGAQGKHSRTTTRVFFKTRWLGLEFWAWGEARVYFTTDLREGEDAIIKNYTSSTPVASYLRIHYHNSPVSRGLR